MSAEPALSHQPITVLVCALGGEGGGVLAEWLVDVARLSGHDAQSTSIPGVAQRTGATTYYIEVFPRPASELGGRKPVFSLSPVPGALDLLVSSELLETVRQVGAGMTTAQRTCVISSSHRTLTTAEKLQMGDGRASTPQLLQVLQTHSRVSHVFDMAGMAQRSGTVVSAVLLGAMAASGVLPFWRATYEQVVRNAGVGVDASLRGFSQAFEEVSTVRSGQAEVQALHPPALDDETPSAMVAELRQAFPPPAHEMLEAGHARVLEFQNAGYAKLYVERMKRVLAAERTADPEGHHGYATTRETARYLALWMAFDDIVRVAELKCRASRLARVRTEVKAGDDELLRLYDHFKPGVPEFAALLPGRLADALTRWDRRRTARGKPPFALPLKIGTHTVLGFLALRTLASLKGMRQRGSRYAAEQAMIERWLAGVERGARAHWQLGNELAECGRLIKGYGTTNERGKDNLLHVLDHLATTVPFGSDADRASAIAAARAAALADDAGKALDQTLLNHGAPARPVKAQPILWVKKRPGVAGSESGTRG